MDKEDGKGRSAHRDYAYSILIGATTIEVGKPSEEQLTELCLYLADLCLGSPAICLLRSFLTHFQPSTQFYLSVYRAALGFTALFNKPESIAILRLCTESREYHRAVIEYCSAGNLQSMLDEFIYILCNDISEPQKIAERFSDILSLRSSTVHVDDYKSFRAEAVFGQVTRAKTTLRTHYAMDFGNQKRMEAGAGRMIDIKDAFNSPFRPFVLATTSIGQEGLDFHWYCKKIFHWNLPSNPIDFEQREGRIHRYKGHVIRLNLARKYKQQLTGDLHRSIWEIIFEKAAPEKLLASVQCDLIPFWHINHGPDAVNIERYVPIYPFSKDIEKFKHLIKVLTYYRLTFGQPRQEDLVESLSAMGFDEEKLKMLDGLLMNLSPMFFHEMKG